MMSSIFGKKGQDVMGLFKQTFKIIGKDKDLLVPIYYIGFYRTISLVLFTTSGFMFFLKDIGPAALVLIVALAYLPISAFLQIRHQAALSWMTVEVLKGKDTDLDSGFKRLKGLNGKLFLIALINGLVKQRPDAKESGIKAFIVSLLLSVIREVWELAQNFLIPAIVIDKVGVEEAAEKLKGMKKNIPAALAGVLAADVASGFVAGIISTASCISTVLGFVLGYAGAKYLPASFLFEGETPLNCLPAICLVCLTSLLSTWLMAGLAGIKSIYYAIFYTTLNHPLEIQESMRPEITNYLNYNGHTKNFDFFSFLSPKKEAVSEFHISASTEFDQVAVNKIKAAIHSNLTKGHDIQVIKDFLLKKNISAALISVAETEYVEEKTAEVMESLGGKLPENFSEKELIKFLREKGVPSIVMQKVLKAA